MNLGHYHLSKEDYALFSGRTLSDCSLAIKAAPEYFRLYPHLELNRIQRQLFKLLKFHQLKHGPPL